MIVITDSNIVFSALYAPQGIIASILLKNKGKIQLFAPDFLIVEVKNHLSEIIETRNVPKKQILLELKLILENISIIKVEEIPKINVIQAIEIVKDIDTNDILFVALHLFTKHKIWTGDKPLRDGLAKKGYKICVSTQELISKLYKKK